MFVEKTHPEVVVVTTEERTVEDILESEWETEGSRGYRSSLRWTREDKRGTVRPKSKWTYVWKPRDHRISSIRFLCKSTKWRKLVKCPGNDNSPIPYTHRNLNIYIVFDEFWDLEKYYNVICVVEISFSL